MASPLKKVTRSSRIQAADVSYEAILSPGLPLYIQQFNPTPKGENCLKLRIHVTLIQRSASITTGDATKKTLSANALQRTITHNPAEPLTPSAKSKKNYLF